MRSPPKSASIIVYVKMKVNQDRIINWLVKFDKAVSSQLSCKGDCNIWKLCFRERIWEIIILKCEHIFCDEEMVIIYIKIDVYFSPLSLFFIFL